jgi:hypothetical protein
MRPIVAAALRNPLSRIGVGLTTASALLFLFLLALELAGFLKNPYAGLVVFVMVPFLFVVGLLLIPIGVANERRREARGQAPAAWPRIDLNDPRIRRTVFLLVTATFVNLAIVSFASYGAVEYTESQTFCGQACHTVMEPEFVAHQTGPHGRVHCVTCHVGEGAEGFLTAKLNGTRQLALAITGGYSHPIPTPIQNFPSVANSCENCHHPNRFVGDVIKVLYEHADDESNTETKTTLRIHVGGPIGGTGTGSGIHWHMNRSNQVEFVALDDKREQIPYVRVSTPDGRVREYFAEGVTPAAIEGKPRRRMDCLDCHSRPAHTFAASPEREVDAAIGAGQISSKIPFIRREAVRALKGPYTTREAALRDIDRSIREAMNTRLPHTFEEADLSRAIGVTQAIYNANVFPSMKVGWGTYPNQLGHTISTGCFRCHDESHKTKDGVAIRQECELCHTIE